jgi:hypothetical protein
MLGANVQMAGWQCPLQHQIVPETAMPEEKEEGIAVAVGGTFLRPKAGTS